MNFRDWVVIVMTWILLLVLAPFIIVGSGICCWIDIISDQYSVDKATIREHKLQKDDPR